MFGAKLETATDDLLSAARGDNGQLKNDLRRLQVSDSERDLAELELFALRFFIVSHLLGKHYPDPTMEEKVFSVFLDKAKSWLSQKPGGQAFIHTFLNRHQEYHACLKSDPRDDEGKAASLFAVALGRDPACQVTKATFVRTFNDTAKLNDFWIKRLRIREH